MKIHKVAGTLVAGAAACLLMATQASASVIPPDGGSWDHVWTTQDAKNGGTLYVEEHGDIVELCDTAADGYAPRADITWSTGGGVYGYHMVADGGYGSCVVHDAAEGGIYDLPEGYEIVIAVYLGPNEASVYSTTFINDH